MFSFLKNLFGGASARAMGLVLILCGCLHLSLGLAYIRSSSATYDEPLHLASGYSYLKTGRYSLNIFDHPPLAEMLAALPLLIASPVLDTSDPDYVHNAQYPFADRFLYHNRVAAAKMLNSARCWCLVFWMLLIGGIAAVWSWRLVGPGAAMVTAFLFALCPAFLSNDALVTTDAAAAAFFFLPFWLMSEAFSGDPNAGWRPLLLAAIATGLALASKFSTVIAPPLVLILATGENWRQRRITWVSFARLTLLYLFVAGLTLALVYRIGQLPLYWEGLLKTFTRLSQGCRSFVLGVYTETGVWWYFPLVLAVKTPLSTLLLAAFGIGPLLQKASQGQSVALSRKEAKRRKREATQSGSVQESRSALPWLWLCLPPSVYFIATLGAKVQLGYRHLLPVLPFVLVLAGVGAMRLFRRGGFRAGLAALLLAGQAVSVLNVAPFFLAYFNEIAGGPSNGYKFLSDSNLDWGQALPALAERLRSIGNPPVLLDCFGVADPAAYGIRFVQVFPPPDLPLRQSGEDPGTWNRMLLAVSATERQAVYISDRTVYDWLKTRRPLWECGYAI